MFQAGTFVLGKAGVLLRKVVNKDQVMLTANSRSLIWSRQDVLVTSKPLSCTSHALNVREITASAVCRMSHAQASENGFSEGNVQALFIARTLGSACGSLMSVSKMDSKVKDINNCIKQQFSCQPGKPPSHGPRKSTSASKLDWCQKADREGNIAIGNCRIKAVNCIFIQ